MRHLVLTLMLTGTLSAGCVFAKSSDGGSRTKSGDCDSGQCLGNVCMGSPCNCPDGCPATGEVGDGCVDGFRCIHVDGEPVFGIGSGDYCELACDATTGSGCPATFVCGDTGECEYEGPQLDIDYTPTAPRAHENVHLTAVMTPMTATSFTWTIDDGTTLDGIEVDHVFNAGLTDIELKATDPNGNIQYGNATINACPNTGDSCMFGAACCDGLTCNAQQICQ